MKLMRLAMCVAVFALVGGIAFSEDMDVRALQAKLASQEARLNDLQAKIYGNACGEKEPLVADGITSLRKNAVVTIGGTVNTRWFSRNATVETNLRDAAAVAPTGNAGNAVFNQGFNAVNIGRWDGAGAPGAAGAFAQGTATTGGTTNVWYTAVNNPANVGLVRVDNGAVGTPGYYTTRAIWNDATNHTLAPTNTWRKTGKANYESFGIADAKLEVKIDVNDYFDAYVKLDFQDNDYDRAGTAEKYWIRWKNVCNSGFSFKVGRDAVTFGSGMGAGILDNWVCNYSAGADALLGPEDLFAQATVSDAAGTAASGIGIAQGQYWAVDANNNIYGNVTGSWANSSLSAGDYAMFGGGMVPLHANWDYGRTVQLQPSWQTQDGRFAVEASIFQELDTRNGGAQRIYYDSNGTHRHGSANFGFGSFSTRVTAKPIEGLTIVASFMSLYAKNDEGLYLNNKGAAWAPANNVGLLVKNRSNAINAGISYTPAFFDRLNLWGQYMHGWNNYWIQGNSSDSWNFGASVGITDQLTWFAQGDLLYSKNTQGTNFYKSSGWATHTGLQYTLPYGVNMEAGWRHEYVNYKNRGGVKTAKFKSDTIYAHLGFDF